MKNLINSLNPVNIIKRLILVIKEFLLFINYLKTLKIMEKDLEDSKIVRFSRYSLGKAINLKPETLLLANKHESDMTEDEKKELNKLELSFISREIAKHNDIFINSGIIELIKTKADRIKNNDYYGYIVEISYNWNHAKPYKVVKLIFHIAIWITVLALLPYKSMYEFTLSLF